MVSSDSWYVVRSTSVNCFNERPMPALIGSESLDLPLWAVANEHSVAWSDSR